MLDFRPPKDSEVVISLLKAFTPIILKLGLGESSIRIRDEDIEKFKKLKGKKAMICPNHSNRRDPEVMFAVSREVQEEFNYIAAREVFDWKHGLNGWFLQRVGTYSVVRGAVDRDSFKTTRNILARGKKKLVLFPEGEISRQNDTVLALESGAAQLSFWALSDILKKDPDDTLYIIPIALKYIFTSNISSAIRASLITLEKELGIKPDNISIMKRVRVICETLLGVLEKEYRCEPPKEDSSGEEEKHGNMNARVEALRKFVLHRVAEQLDIELDENKRELENVRVLRNAIDDFIYDTNGDGSQYERKVHHKESERIRGLYKDLDRVVNFISIYDGYLTENMSQERCADIVGRLEKEILGQYETYKGPRTVNVRVGDPIDLKDFKDDYDRNKKEAVQKVTETIFNRISSMLNEIENRRQATLVE